MVRPSTTAPRVGRQVAIVFVIAALVAGGAVLLITQLRKDSGSAAPEEARPDIRMPPPMLDASEPVAVTPDAAAITPDAEEEEVEIEVDDEEAGSGEPAPQVKLRDEEASGSQSPPKKKKTKRIRRPKQPPTETPPDNGDPKWDPTTLMPPKK